MVEQLKGYLTGIIVRWLLKTIGGYFFIDAAQTFFGGTLEQHLVELVGGFLSIVAGIVISLMQHKTALVDPKFTILANQKLPQE